MVRILHPGSRHRSLAMATSSHIPRRPHIVDRGPTGPVRFSLKTVHAHETGRRVQEKSALDGEGGGAEGPRWTVGEPRTCSPSQDPLR